MANPQAFSMRVHTLVLCLGGQLLASCGNDEPIIARDEAPPAPIFIPRAINDAPGARRFVEIAPPGSVPLVMDQPSDRGKSIGALASFGSRVFLGYGDYSNNTGPIVSLSYSLSDAEFHFGSELSTEEVLEFQHHSGYLFAADLDPRGHEALGSVFRLEYENAEWRKMSDIEGAVHTFAMTEFGGRLFATSGSVLADAARVVSSDNAGETWRDEHTTVSPAEGFSRYTHMAASESLLFVSGRVHATPEQGFAYTLSKGDWTPVQAVPQTGFLIPIALGDELIVARFSRDKGKGGTHLQSFELNGDTLAPAQPLPASERLVNWSPLEALPWLDRGLWVLSERDDAKQAVHLATSFDSWELIAELPTLNDGDSFTALCYLDDGVYLGTALGGLYAIEEVFELVDS
jgi:hypothetical protein